MISSYFPKGNYFFLKKKKKEKKKWNNPTAELLMQRPKIWIAFDLRAFCVQRNSNSWTFMQQAMEKPIATQRNTIEWRIVESVVHSIPIISTFGRGRQGEEEGTTTHISIRKSVKRGIESIVRCVSSRLTN